MSTKYLGNSDINLYEAEVEDGSSALQNQYHNSFLPGGSFANKIKSVAPEKFYGSDEMNQTTTYTLIKGMEYFEGVH